MNLQGEADEVLFEKITGTASAYGTITVSNERSTIVEKVIHIYESGSVEIE